MKAIFTALIFAALLLTGHGHKEAVVEEIPEVAPAAEEAVEEAIEEAGEAWFNVEDGVLTVSLEGNYTTGYNWFAVSADEAVAALTSEAYVLDGEAEEAVEVEAEAEEAVAEEAVEAEEAAEEVAEVAVEETVEEAAEAEEVAVEAEVLPDEAAPDMVGVGGTYVATFAGVADGVTEINFYYIRAWETTTEEAAPDRTLVVTVLEGVIVDAVDVTVYPEAVEEAEPFAAETEAEVADAEIKEEIAE